MTNSRISCRPWIFLIVSATIYAPVGYAQVAQIAGRVAEVCRHLSGQPEAQFLPGAYFEMVATRLSNKGDKTGALEAYEHAAYYGNRAGQYEMGMMYLEGAEKVPKDVPLGIAWLKVSSKYGHRGSINALKKLTPALSQDQQEEVEREFQKIDAEYNPNVTQKRVMNAFALERNQRVRASWICQEDGETVPAEKYYAQVDQDYADYVTTMYGKVTVGPLQPGSSTDTQK